MLLISEYRYNKCQENEIRRMKKAVGITYRFSIDHFLSFAVNLQSNRSCIYA